MVDSQYETMSRKGTIAISGSEMTTPSKRSCDDIVDHPDTTSTSKVRPVKRIKVEKMINDELSIKKNTKAGEYVSGVIMLWRFFIILSFSNKCSRNTMF
ncbi:unnamed protein product [Brassica napus]|uniref:(rape) hypothetical protein n=1 Tax=Brassica napus TaxID=3708 RepID=A0A816J1W9_BRANA|nr:unnamed protein product [Brassica napus]